VLFPKYLSYFFVQLTESLLARAMGKKFLQADFHVNMSQYKLVLASYVLQRFAKSLPLPLYQLLPAESQLIVKIGKHLVLPLKKL
jgi:hypothetical protein